MSSILHCFYCEHLSVFKAIILFCLHLFSLSLLTIQNILCLVALFFSVFFITGSFFLCYSFSMLYKSDVHFLYVKSWCFCQKPCLGVVMDKMPLSTGSPHFSVSLRPCPLYVSLYMQLTVPLLLLRHVAARGFIFQESDSKWAALVVESPVFLLT